MIGAEHRLSEVEACYRCVSDIAVTNVLGH